jgi:hypothetical protein
MEVNTQREITGHEYENLIRYGLIPLTILLATLYLCNGYRTALLLPGGSNDLVFRYQEEWHILQGVNPNNILEWKRGYPGAKPVMCDQRVGLSPGGGGYPPWAYFTGLFLVPVFPWPITKLFFAILNAVSLGITAWFSYRVTSPHGHLPAIGMATSVLAVGSNSFALGSVQYGLIVNALISGMALCASANRPIWAGILYGVSLVKPILSAPFFFVLVAKRRWLAITAAIIYIVTACLAIWAITGTDPLTMVLQFLDRRRAGGLIGGTGGTTALGPVNLALRLGFSESITVILIAITNLVVGFVVMWVFRGSPLIILLAIASVFGYIWTAHRSYDDVMMVFLLIAIGDLALRKVVVWNGIVFTLVAITLWLPPSASNISYFRYIKLVIWIFSIVYLLQKNRGNQADSSSLKVEPANAPH